jgi:hypothetical protein
VLQRRTILMRLRVKILMRLRRRWHGFWQQLYYCTVHTYHFFILFRYKVIIKVLVFFVFFYLCKSEWGKSETVLVCDIFHNPPIFEKLSFCRGRWSWSFRRIELRLRLSGSGFTKMMRRLAIPKWDQLY